MMELDLWFYVSVKTASEQSPYGNVSLKHVHNSWPCLVIPSVLTFTVHLNPISLQDWSESKSTIIMDNSIIYARM